MRQFKRQQIVLSLRRIQGHFDRAITFGNLLDPLLSLLGIGLGEGEMTVHELIIAP